MKRLHYVYGFLSLLITVAFSSCIQDDLSDCISDKRIYFDYEQISSSQKNGGINPDDIARMNLFIFDEKGLFVKECTDEAPRMNKEYFMTISGLTKGFYRFVAWGNLKEQYTLSSTLVAGETTFDDLMVSLNNIKDGKVSQVVEPLFYATHKGNNTVEILEMSTQFVHLNLVEDTYKINVTVSGLDSTTVADNEYSVDVTDNNGAYKFSNDFAQCQEFQYTQPCTIDREPNSELKSSLTVLRLTEKRKPILRLVNKQTNVVVVEDNLVGLILAANEAGAAIDFDKTHEFDIKYELGQTSSVDIVIYINGWKLIKQSGELN
ncbi:MAG: FimB/Mfa2 family fimbrial subunit [Tannerellaceae bacterium]|jgi:predicted secreted protein|nr:FimB/Mfa2 family fimbrial subunit [Tannerellaceae bacterium]